MGLLESGEAGQRVHALAAVGIPWYSQDHPASVNELRFAQEVMLAGQ